MNDPYITNVKLLNVPLESDSLHTLYFTSASTQQSYFESKVVEGCNFTDFSYQRKDQTIRVPLQYDSLISKGINYVMYQNKAFSNKWFYAFIKDIIFVSNGRSDLVIETDVIQTWFFDYTVKPSFVEREHVDDDTIGLHTLPENLETGEYIARSDTQYSNISDCHVVVALSYDISKDELTYTDFSTKHNGIPSGLTYYLIGDWTSVNALNAILATLSKGKLDALIAVFLAPDSLTGYDQTTEDWKYLVGESGNFQYAPYKILPSSTGAKLMETISISKPLSDISGYTPRNKKLFTFPYQYLLVDNNGGASFRYNYEHFTNCQFVIKGAITPGCSIRCIPKNYKNQAENNNEGINATKFPIGSCATDVYTNWLTQNAVNIGVGVASSGLQVVGGIGAMLTGAGAGIGAGMITNGALGIASSLGQVYQHSLMPPQVEGNINSGDVTYAMGNSKFSFYKMQIKKEYAEIIDKYFDMYGYKVNLVKTPNKAHRSRYWYTKTIDVNIDGAIPNMDMQKIKDCYNRGITFWRNELEIQNYSLSNTIV